MSNKIMALVEMKSALENLRKAWIECDYAFDNCYVNCNNYILGDAEEENEYPFHMSFEEMNTINWIDGCLEKIFNDLEKLVEE